MLQLGSYCIFFTIIVGCAICTTLLQELFQVLENLLSLNLRQNITTKTCSSCLVIGYFSFFTLTTNTFKLYRKQFSLTPQDSNVSRTLADFKFCLESVPCYKLEMKILSFILFLILFLIFLILLLILFFYENQNPFWSIVSFLLTVLLYIKNKTLPWFDIESYLVSGGGISIGQKSTSLLVYHFCSSRVCYTTQERTNRWRCSVHGCHNEVRLWKRHLVR